MRILRLLKPLFVVFPIYILLIPAGSDLVKSAEQYKWNHVPIGGGGYVTGLVIHPTEPDLVYVRTDVGGAYRLDKVKGEWIPLMDHLEDRDSNLYGVDGMAIDPQNPDVVYVAAGKYGNEEPNDVLKSTDRGETWTRLGLNLRNESNGNIHRAMGESIAVNPTNSNYLHVGTRYDGLYMSSDAGATWSHVRDVPVGIPGQGIRSVAYGLNPITKQGQVVYVGVRGIGVYSKAPRANGQTTWELTRRSPEYVARMAVAKSGTLYATTDNQGVFKYDGTQWRNITPSVSYSSYYGISIDPNNDNHILVAVRTGGDNLPLYRSLDGGLTWTTVNKTLISKPSWWTPNMFFSATSSIVFDPNEKGAVYATDWFGVYKTNEINESSGLSGTTSVWEALTEGHEEVVSLTACTPPGGASFFSGLTDQIGFRHAKTDQIPGNKIPLTGMREIVSIDYQETEPDNMIFLGSSDWYGSTTRLFVSVDNGMTVNPVNVPAGSVLGKVAYSATNPNLFVYFPQTGNPVRSTDGGGTWQNMNGAPFQSIGGSGIVFSYNHPLAADRVDGNKFYIYKAGYLYRSSDAGANWAKANVVPLPINSDILKVEAAPGMDGTVWVSLGSGGLFASTNGGNSFTQVQDVQNSKLFAFGKNKPGNDVPSVYVYGTVNQTDGFFRSDNLGATWTNISPIEDIGISNEPQIMVADRQIYGQVYVGTNGRGIYVGSLEQ